MSDALATQTDSATDLVIPGATPRACYNIRGGRVARERGKGPTSRRSAGPSASLCREEREGTTERREEGREEMGEQRIQEREDMKEESNTTWI
ncbi:hypothetical protein EYF80_055079 [Liparis tanakae]|uniref:Uncharacterized protein n=1 Tax=Liparis tanakae TaxID=230148 RepID=A0A4Z2F0M6_9TELE|nr:hypothetical protein EYF80_055079 [Liparis tanakae]